MRLEAAKWKRCQEAFLCFLGWPSWDRPRAIQAKFRDHHNRLGLSRYREPRRALQGHQGRFRLRYPYTQERSLTPFPRQPTWCDVPRSERTSPHPDATALQMLNLYWQRIPKTNLPPAPLILPSQLSSNQITAQPTTGPDSRQENGSPLRRSREARMKIHHPSVRLTDPRAANAGRMFFRAVECAREGDWPGPLRGALASRYLS